MSFDLNKMFKEIDGFFEIDDYDDTHKKESVRKEKKYRTISFEDLSLTLEIKDFDLIISVLEKAKEEHGNYVAAVISIFKHWRDKDEQ